MFDYLIVGVATQLCCHLTFAHLTHSRNRAAPKRVPQVPNVPTVSEAGGPKGLDVNSFVVLVSPKGIPTDVSSRINADVQKVLADPEVKARYNTFAFEALNWSPDEIRKQADIKNKIYGKLVARKNISLE